MSSYAQVAHDKRNQALADMRAILDRAAEEKRDITEALAQEPGA